MTLLRFDTTLYDLVAVNRAVEAFSGCAKLVVTEQPGYVTISVEAFDSGKQQMIDGELGNYVLGATIDLRSGALGIAQR